MKIEQVLSCKLFPRSTYNATTDALHQACFFGQTGEVEKRTPDTFTSMFRLPVNNAVILCHADFNGIQRWKKATKCNAHAYFPGKEITS